MRQVTILLSVMSLSAFAAGRIDLLSEGEAFVRAGEETLVTCKAKPKASTSTAALADGAKLYTISSSCDRTKPTGSAIDRDQKARKISPLDCNAKRYWLVGAVDEKNSIYATTEKGEQKLLQMTVVESEDLVSID